MSVLLLLLNLREDETKVMISATQSGLPLQKTLIACLSRIRKVYTAISYIVLVWLICSVNRLIEASVLEFGGCLP